MAAVTIPDGCAGDYCPSEEVRDCWWAVPTLPVASGGKKPGNSFKTGFLGYD